MSNTSANSNHDDLHQTWQGSKDQNHFIGLVKNSSVYILSNAINASAFLLLLPLLTRYLSPEDYGTATMFQISVSYVILIASLNAHTIININFFKTPIEELRDNITSVISLVALISIIVFIVAFAVAEDLSNLLGFSGNWILALVVIADAEIIFLINMGLWRTEQRPKPYGITQILKTFTNITLIYLFVSLFHMRWVGWLTAIMISSLSFGVISLIAIYKRGYLGSRPSIGHMRSSLKFGIPMLPHSLGALLIFGVDRFFISSMVGLGATGLYTVGFQIARILEVVSTSFNRAWSPFLFKQLKTANEATKKKLIIFTYGYFTFIFIFAVCLVSISPYIFSFIIGEGFAKGATYATWLVMGNMAHAMYFMVANYIFYVKRTYLLACVTITTAGINCILNYIFIRYNGAVGAAQATVISLFLQFIGTWLLSARVFKMPWNLMQTQETNILHCHQDYHH